MSSASRPAHLAPALIICAIAASVTWLSFTQQPAEAFLFPRVVSVAFMALASWNLARAALGLSKVGGGIPMAEARNIAPGFLIILIYVFWGARTLGFYVSSTIAFFVLYSLYDPEPVSNLRHWLKRVLITATFIAILYGLFAILLQVQTPRGAFI